MSNIEDNSRNQTDHPQASLNVEQSMASYWRRAARWVGVSHIEDESRWFEDMRGMLSVVATMIATMTFQVAMNPPGGVVEAHQGVTLDVLSACVDDYSRPCAGDAVAALLNPDYYNRFQIYNTVCFVASVSVSLLLISGISLNHKFPIWILSVGMIITLSFLALTYLSGTLLVTPAHNDTWQSFRGICKRTIETWIVLVGIVGLFLTIRFLVWFVRKCIRVIRYCKRMAPRN